MLGGTAMRGARTTGRTDATAGTGATGGARRRGSARALAAVLLAGALALAGCGGGGDDGGGDSGKAAGGGARKEAVADAGAGGHAGPRAQRGDQADAAGERDRGADGAGGKAGRAADAKARGKADAQAVPDGTHLIRTASLTVRVKDVPPAVERARTAAQEAGGLVGAETTDRDGHGRERSRLVLRVPQDRYQRVLTDLEGTGRLVRRTADAEDVTEQVVDVESRVRTQRASVARVRALLGRATRISDIVSLEEQLSTRQADLESLLARRASLKDRTTLATITLTLTESPSAGADDGADDDDPTFVDALAGGWGAFVTVLRWGAVALGAALPFVVGAAVLVLVWLRVVRPRWPRTPDAS
ncbi:DUF4349 domain-containing protein [Streptomyces sp. G45]|uniref:DUF4349 domain-containing protein n=1 Tax=Streptomyces sp. G45 TaxID=3406627 RepID=UPI003C26C8B2